jgi:hypothetical protein
VLEKILVVIIAQFSDYLWKALLLEARVYRGKVDLQLRIDAFKAHLADIEAAKYDDDSLKNERLDNAARSLLYGMRRQ